MKARFILGGEVICEADIKIIPAVGDEFSIKPVPCRVVRREWFFEESEQVVAVHLVEIADLGPPDQPERRGE
jgi:hypothetical protein